MKFYLILIFLLSRTLYAEGSRELGLKSTLYQKSDDYSVKPYFYLGEKIDLKSELNLNFAVRGNIDIPDSRYQKIDIRELTLKKSGNFYTLEWGLQVFNWSETFGVNIMDLVNPRDYHEAVFDELDWSQIPVWSLKNSISFYDITLIPIYTLKARANIYPKSDDYYDSVPAPLKNLERVDTQNYRWFKDSEYGFKLNYLFFSNLDLSLIYFKHYSRQINYQLKNGKLYTENDRVQSYGLTFSYTFDSLVFRGDSLYSKNYLQGIYGLDRNFLESWFIGMQYHFDNNVDKSWGAIKLKREIQKIPVTLEFMNFFGIDNDDFWIRPEVTYNAKNGIAYHLLADIFTNDNSTGVLKIFNGKNRVVLNMNYLF